MHPYTRISRRSFSIGLKIPWIGKNNVLVSVCFYDEKARPTRTNEVGSSVQKLNTCLILGDVSFAFNEYV